MATKEGGAERQSRATPDRKLEDDDKDPRDLFSASEGDDDAPSPDEIIKENQRLIQAANDRADSERDARVAAEKKAEESGTRARTAETSAFEAAEKAVDGQLEAQKNIVTQAQARYRAARENGDFDAEVEALDALTDAKNAVSSLNGQKTYLTQQKTVYDQRVKQAEEARKNAPATRTPGLYSEKTQEWIGKHPEFNTDPFYKSIAIGAAQAAVQDGCVADSPQFFRFIEQTLERAMGNNRQQSNPDHGGQQQQQRRTGPNASSMAAPPSRENTSTRQRGGAPSPEAVARQLNCTVQDLRDFARFAKMKFEDYVSDQASIILEQSRGQDTGLFRGEEGKTVG